MEQQIKHNFEEGEEIHAVFISHLDEDHINGLPELLKFCNVKMIFFPLLTERSRTLMQLYWLVHNGAASGFLYEFLQNPYDALDRLNLESVPALYQVGENNEGSYDGIDIPFVPSGENVTSRITSRIRGLAKLDLDKWVYVPFNFQHKDRLEKLENVLKTEFGKDMSNEKLFEIWETGATSEMEKIKSSYRKVPGSFNTNSMTLFSGTLEMKGWQYKTGCHLCSYCKYGFCYGVEKKSGCLFTGDYNASGGKQWKQLRAAYDTYWNQIGCVQIPHRITSFRRSIHVF